MSGAFSWDFLSLGYAACLSKNVVHDIFAHLLRESQDLREETADPGIPHIQQSNVCIGRLSVK